MLNKKTLEEIGSRPGGVGVAPLIAAAAALASLATLAFSVTSVTSSLAILVAGLLLALLVYARRRRRRTVTVRYDLDNDAHFAAMDRACASLAASERVWAAGDGPGKRKEPVRTVEVARRNPPGVSVNVAIWSMDLPDIRIFFLPDTVLLLKDGHYKAISHESLDVAFSPEYRAEEGDPPSDAEVIGRTWQHVREDGGPDLRFQRNPRLTEVVYGRLDISGPGFGAHLLVSSRNAAMRFARTFGGERSRPLGGDGGNGEAGEGTPRTDKEDMRVELAYGILGLRAGSPREQVTIAYRKLAKLHHPDLLQDLDPKSREVAEDRMRAINLAYSDLKRRNN